MDNYTELQLDRLDDSIENLKRGSHFQSMERKELHTIVDRLRKTRRQLDVLLGEAEDAEREHLLSAFESVRDIELLRDKMEGLFEKLSERNERPD